MAGKSILLADADTVTAAEFRRVLSQDWQVTHVLSGPAALEEMKKRAYDVLVASLDLPEMDGAQLLNRIRSRYPNTVRFIAATEADKERVVKKMLGAHQFLTKPFEGPKLNQLFEQALALDVWIASESVRKLASRVRSFPMIPSLYLDVLAALRSPDATTEQIGGIIAKDMAMTTKLLQVVNSAYFGLSRQINDPAEAVAILGFENVKSMVAAVKLLAHYDRIKPVYFSIDRLWRHSTEVAQRARQLALEQTGDQAMANCAFTAGLMHDVGKVVLAGNFNDQYHGAQALARKQQLPFWELEKEIFGGTHGEIGAYLLGLWGMPLPLLEATALHHVPSRSLNQEFSPLTAVHIANVLISDANPDKDDPVPPQLDEPYLAELGLLETVKAWRNPAPNKPVEAPAPKPGSQAPAIPKASLESAPTSGAPAIPDPAAAALPLPAPVREPAMSVGRQRWVYAGVIAVLLALLLGIIAYRYFVD